MSKYTEQGSIFIDGYQLLARIDTIACKDLPVDPQWLEGLKYSKRIIRDAMNIDQEDEVKKNKRK